MAKKSGRNKSTDELRAEIAHSRERVARDLRGLHYELNFPAKLRRSSKRYLAYSGGGCRAWFFCHCEEKFTSIKKRPHPSKLVETGFASALKIAASLLRPVIVDLVKNR
jgi:hypothetical protein